MKTVKRSHTLAAGHPAKGAGFIRGLRPLAFAATSLLSLAAHPQSSPADYPAQPITIIVPFTVGGGSDAVTRIITTRITERTGKAIIIDNRGGAGTNIGNEMAARAAPNGYTYLLGQFTLAINPSLYKKLQYRVDKDFIPVAHIADSPTILSVGMKSPITDVRSLIERARAAPGSLNYGSGGTGTPPHLSGELLQKLTGIKLVHVPYKGSGPAMTDVIAGQLDFCIDTSGGVIPQIEGGKLKGLAIAGPKRLSEIPDVPTFAEAGLRDMEVLAWYGFVAPTGTPEAAVKWMNTRVNEAIADPTVAARLQKIGALPVGGTPQELGRFMQKETTRWAGIIRELNIQLD
ncbi:MAG TPA: tripartite tricarboxylate transporter substrate binding protein [Burkholderiales bacterium]|jgi:tripartite-type tricarboxylate transporter receptor subunit TctC|nr:tripartite tricarboxylate transporter substrate binding protein [Burkholderiales bacterium]